MPLRLYASIPELRDFGLAIRAVKQIDDSRARQEWGWNPTFNYDRMVKEVIRELSEHPERYE